MGFFTETLRLVIDADSAGAVRGVERFGGAAEKEFGRAEGSLDKWGNRLTTVGAGMIGFGTAALFGLGKAAQASEAAQLSVVKLENTLGNMPKLAGENSKQFLDLADSIQDVTAADGDAIVEGQALLGTFSLTAKEIKGITPLVVDYARKFGIDIPDAAIQVGKALDGQVGALKRNGVSIDETLFKTDRYAAVQEALSDQVGGFAEDEGKMFAGSLERLKNQMGDLVEGVGGGAVDAFTDMFDAVDPLIDRFNELDPSTQSVIGKVAAFGSVALIAAGGASVLIGQVMTMHERFSTAAAAARQLAGSEGLSRLTSTAAVASIQIGLLLLAGEGFNKFFPDERANVDKLANSLLKLGESGKVSGELAKIMGEDLGDLKEAIDHVIDPSGFQEFSHALEEVASLGGILPTGGESFADFTGRIDDLDKALADLAATHPQEAAAALDGLIEKLGLSDGAAIGFIRSLDEYDATLARADTANQSAAGSMGATGDALDEQATAAEVAKTALEEYENQLNAMMDPLFGAVDAQRQHAEARTAETQATDALNAAIATYGAESLAAMAAAGELHQAQLDTGTATMDLDLAMQQLTTSVRSGETSLVDARAKLAQWVDQGLITQGAADAMAQSFSGARDRANELGNTDPNIAVSVIGDVEARERIENVRSSLAGIPTSRTIHFGVTGYTGAGLYGRAHGGPVDEGMPYWVGENRRPELFVPNSDGHIYTEQQLAAASPGGGGGWGGGPTQVQVAVRFEKTGDRLLDTIIEGLRGEVRKSGRGNAQQFFGRN